MLGWLLNHLPTPSPTLGEGGGPLLLSKALEFVTWAMDHVAWGEMWPSSLSLPPLLFSGAKQQKSLSWLALIRKSPYEKGKISADLQLPFLASLPPSGNLTPSFRRGRKGGFLCSSSPSSHRHAGVAQCPSIYLGAPKSHQGNGVFSTTDSIALPSALPNAIGLLQVNKNIFQASPQSLIFQYKLHHVFGAQTSSTVNLLS